MYPHLNLWVIRVILDKKWNFSTFQSERWNSFNWVLVRLFQRRRRRVQQALFRSFFFFFSNTKTKCSLTLSRDHVLIRQHFVWVDFYSVSLCFRCKIRQVITDTDIMHWRLCVGVATKLSKLSKGPKYRDPNMPKRPLNSYIRFYKEYWEQYKNRTESTLINVCDCGRVYFISCFPVFLFSCFPRHTFPVLLISTHLSQSPINMPYIHIHTYTDCGCWMAFDGYLSTTSQYRCIDKIISIFVAVLLW